MRVNYAVVCRQYVDRDDGTIDILGIHRSLEVAELPHEEVVLLYVDFERRADDLEPEYRFTIRLDNPDGEETVIKNTQEPMETHPTDPDSHALYMRNVFRITAAFDRYGEWGFTLYINSAFQLRIRYPVSDPSAPTVLLPPRDY
jgi:hypothetical protein